MYRGSIVDVKKKLALPQQQIVDMAFTSTSGSDVALKAGTCVCVYVCLSMCVCVCARVCVDLHSSLADGLHFLHVTVLCALVCLYLHPCLYVLTCVTVCVYVLTNPHTGDRSTMRQLRINMDTVSSLFNYPFDSYTIPVRYV